MDRGYSSGVNREEPHTTLLPFCDELFIYPNDDDYGERKSEFDDPSSARSVKTRRNDENIRGIFYY